MIRPTAPANRPLVHLLLGASVLVAGAACSSQASAPESVHVAASAIGAGEPDDATPLPGDEEPVVDPDDGDATPVPPPAVSATRTDVSSACVKVWPMMVPWGVLTCDCYKVSKTCSDASCSNCDGTRETRQLCASRSSVLPRTTAACSAAQQDDCAAFCASSCTGGCAVTSAPSPEAVAPVE